jgi:hypothetical protein
LAKFKSFKEFIDMTDPSLLSDRELPGVAKPEPQETKSAISDIQLTARRIIVWSAILGAAFFSGIGVLPIVRAYWQAQPWVVKIIQQHYAATVGLPAIAVLAFLIVITFEARFDPIEMEFFSIVKFKGASGPIILWAFCFLTMACCIRLLW